MYYNKCNWKKKISKCIFKHFDFVTDRLATSSDIKNTSDILHYAFKLHSHMNDALKTDALNY